jgi:hypothetical protein
MLGTFYDDLCCPPSHHGAVALATVEGLLKWIPMRANTLHRLERCQGELAVFSAGLIVDARTVDFESAREELRRRHAEVDRLYKSFVSLDAMVKRAQQQLTTAYPSPMITGISADEDELQASLSQPTTEYATPDDLGLAVSAYGTPTDGATDFITTKLPDKLSERVYAAIRDRRLLAQMPDVVKVTMAITRAQAVLRGVRTRKRYRTLLRLRYQFERGNVAYQFRWWRAETRATTTCRRRLLWLGIAALQANSNVRQMRRTAFAMHVSKVRTVSTLRRALVVWHRYVKYLSASVDPVTRSRAVTFGYEFSAWNRFLDGESRRLEKQHKCALFGGGRDPLLALAHYLYRWRRYVSKTLDTRNKWQIAAKHREHITCRKHLAAWVHFVSFQSQRDATRVANMRYYLDRWRRGVALQRIEATAVNQFSSVRKLTALCKWRRKALVFRKRRATALIVLQAHRPLLTCALEMWRDGPRAFYCRAFRRWRAFIARRLQWKAFVAMHWTARAAQLKLVAFVAWAKMVADAQNQPLRLKNKTTAGFLDLPQVQKVANDYTSCKVRGMMIARCRDIHAAADSMVLVQSHDGFVLPLAGPNLFERECGVLLSKDNIRRERHYSSSAFDEWHRCAVDRSLGHFVLPLLANHRRARPAPLVSLLTYVPTSDSDTASPARQRWDVLNEIAISVGEPFVGLDRKEVVIGGVELNASETTRSNFGRVTRITRRHVRVNKRSEVLLSTSRLVRVDRYFDAFSPFKMLIERYEEMARVDAKKRDAYGKFKIPLPPVPRKRVLRFLLRGELAAIIGDSGRFNITSNRLVASRIAMIVAYARLSMFLGLHHRVEADAVQRRWATAQTFAVREARELSKEYLERKYRRIAPTLGRAPPTRGLHLLDLVGFNPSFLRGEQKRNAQRMLRLRRALRDANALLRPVYAELRTPLRRTVSDILGACRADIATDRDQRRSQRRRHSYDSIARDDLVISEPGDDDTSDDGSYSNAVSDADGSRSAGGDANEKPKPRRPRTGDRGRVTDGDDSVRAKDSTVNIHKPRRGDSRLNAGPKQHRNKGDGSADGNNATLVVPEGIRSGQEPGGPHEHGGSTADDPLRDELDDDGTAEGPRRSLSRASGVAGDGSTTGPLQSSVGLPPTLAGDRLGLRQKSGQDGRGRSSAQGSSRPGAKGQDQGHRLVQSGDYSRTQSRGASGAGSALDKSNRAGTADKPNKAGTPGGDGQAKGTETTRGEEASMAAEADELMELPDESDTQSRGKGRAPRERGARLYTPPTNKFARSGVPLSTTTTRKPFTRRKLTPASESVQHQFAVAEVPPSLGSGRSPGAPVPSVEHLLEVSARHAGYLNNRARGEIDALKLELAKLVAQGALPMAAPDPGFPATVIPDNSFTEHQQFLSNERLRRLQDSRTALRAAPLVPQHAVTFPYRPSSKRLQAQGSAAVIENDEVSEPSTPLRSPRSRKPQADITVNREFSRHQLLRVPRSIGGGPHTVLAAMNSTAALLNSTALDAFAFRSPPPPAGSNPTALPPGAARSRRQQDVELSDHEVGRLVGFIVHQQGK